MSFITTTDSLTSRPASLTPPILLPKIILNKNKQKKIHKVTFRLTPQIRIKERTPSTLSNTSWQQIQLKEIIFEPQVISFEQAMDMVRLRAAEEEKQFQLASMHSSGFFNSSSNKFSKSESNIGKSSPNVNLITGRKSVSSTARSARVISSSRFRLNENEELKKLNDRIRLKEEKRLRDLEEENRKRAQREAFLEKDRKNKLLLQMKAEEAKKKKEIEEQNRIKHKLENEKNEQLEKIKKIAEIKNKNRAQLEARLSNIVYNIDYTRDRKEIKLKKTNKKIRDAEKEERKAAEKEAKRLAKLREEEDKEKEKELERKRYEQLKQDKLLLLSHRFLSRKDF